MQIKLVVVVVWSVWIKKGSVDSILVATAFAAILWSAFKRVIGRQFLRSNNEDSSLGAPALRD